MGCALGLGAASSRPRIARRSAVSRGDSRGSSASTNPGRDGGRRKGRPGRSRFARGLHAPGLYMRTLVQTAATFGRGLDQDLGDAPGLQSHTGLFVLPLTQLLRVPRLGLPHHSFSFPLTRRSGRRITGQEFEDRSHAPLPKAGDGSTYPAVASRKCAITGHRLEEIARPHCPPPAASSSSGVGWRRGAFVPDASVLCLPHHDNPGPIALRVEGDQVATCPGLRLRRPMSIARAQTSTSTWSGGLIRTRRCSCRHLGDPAGLECRGSPRKEPFDGGLGRGVELGPKEFSMIRGRVRRRRTA